MALFTTADADEIASMVYQQHSEFERLLGIPAAKQPSERNRSSPLYRDLLLLIDIANGTHSRTDELVQQAEQALTYLLAALLGNALAAPTLLPEHFWQSKLGIIVARARWWISADDLITISNAAALAFGANTQANRMRIARAIEGGVLDWVPDPSVANPQQNRRVLRSQVEQLGNLRRPPNAN